MCLQCASQGEKDEDHCKTTFSGGQNGVLTRVLKRTMEMAALMGRLQFLLLELLSTNTCVNTYASARKTHGSKCTKTNLSKAFRANHGTPANISEPSFQHALVFWIKTAILWTKILCPFQRCLKRSSFISLQLHGIPFDSLHSACVFLCCQKGCRPIKYFGNNFLKISVSVCDK